MEADFTDGVWTNKDYSFTPMSSMPTNDSPMASLPSKCEHNQRKVSTVTSQHRKNTIIKSPPAKYLSKSHRCLFHNKVPQVCSKCKGRPNWNIGTKIQHKYVSIRDTVDGENINKLNCKPAKTSGSSSNNKYVSLIGSVDGDNINKLTCKPAKMSGSSPNLKSLKLKNDTTVVKSKPNISPSSKETQLPRFPRLPKFCDEATQTLPEKCTEGTTAVNGGHEAVKVECFLEMGARGPVSPSGKPSLKETSSCNENQFYTHHCFSETTITTSNSLLELKDNDGISNRNSAPAITMPLLGDSRPNHLISSIKEEISSFRLHLSDDKLTESPTGSDEDMEQDLSLLRKNLSTVDIDEAAEYMHGLLDKIEEQYPHLTGITEAVKQLSSESQQFEMEKTRNQTLPDVPVHCNGVKVAESVCNIISEIKEKPLNSSGLLEESCKDSQITSHKEQSEQSTESKVAEIPCAISLVITRKGPSESLTHKSEIYQNSTDYNLPGCCENTQTISSYKSVGHHLSEGNSVSKSANISLSMASLDPSEILERGVKLKRKCGTIKSCSDSALTNEILDKESTNYQVAAKPRAKSTTIIDVISRSLSYVPSSNSSIPSSSQLNSASYYESAWTNGYSEYAMESAV